MRSPKASVFKDQRMKRPWVVRWPERNARGGRIRKSKAFVRQRDAQAYASAKTRELRDGPCAADEAARDRIRELGDTPLSVFVDKYLERRKAEGLRRATLDTFRHIVSRLVKYVGAGRPIASITTDEVSEFLADQRMIARTRVGQPLSKSSRNAIIRHLRILFSHAVGWGYVSASPMGGIRMPKVNDDDKRGWHYFSPRDLLALLRSSNTLREKALYAVSYGSGLRFGELFALHPTDVDLTGGYVHVRPHQATVDTPPFLIKDHERRSVPLPAYAKRLVAGWLQRRGGESPYLFVAPERFTIIRQRWQRMQACGEQWQNRFMVNNAVRNLKQCAKRAGIVPNGPVTMHSLRKSYGRNGARLLSPEVLKEYMGHSDIATTLTFYSKRDAADDAHARWVLDRLVKGLPMQNMSLCDVKATFSGTSEQSRRAG